MGKYVNKMRTALSITILMLLTLLGCSSDTTTETAVISTQPVSTVSQQEVDLPRLTNDEAASLIFSSLASKLPAGYKREQFDLNTRDVFYAGKGKWEFAVQGVAEEVTELPDEKVEESEILWVYLKKERVTTFDLLLTADYFENTGVCEIKNISKTNETSSTNIISTREIEAKLKVKLIKLQYFADRLQVQMTLENVSYIPLNGIVMDISYDKPVKEISSTNFDGILKPEQTAVLLKLIEDENIKDFRYPDHMAFSTASGMDIPFIIAENAYSTFGY